MKSNYTFSQKNTKISRFQLATILVFVSLFLGCKKEEVVIRGCGGTPQERLKGTTFLAIHTDVSLILLSDKYGLVYPCRGDDYDLYRDNLIHVTLALKDSNWSDFDGTWITTDGTLFLPKLDQVNIGVSEDLVDFEVQNEFHLADSYQPKDIIIEIIDSEKNGKQGYGYFIEYQGFKIKQDIIPAAKGIQVFKTRKDAMKIAYFVAYKLKKHTLNFPSVKPQDLRFFNIDHEY